MMIKNDEKNNRRAWQSHLSHERLGRMLAGLGILTAVVMSWLHHPAWLLLAAGTGLNLAISAITDRCAVKSLLIYLGFPGERDLGHAEAIREIFETADLDVSAGTRCLRRKFPVETTLKRVASPLRVRRN